MKSKIEKISQGKFLQFFLRSPENLRAKIANRLKKNWIHFWMRFARSGAFGRISTRIALVPADTFRHRYPLASLFPHGFTAPDARICKSGIAKGKFVYIGSNVTFYRHASGGEISLGDRVFINDDTRMETGFGGSIEIGSGSHIQNGCQFSAYKGYIKVGKNVQIAPGCAFYPYDHAISRDKPIIEQPLFSKGGIKVKEDAWIGYGAVILDGVTVGTGAVVGAGSVVKNDIPDYAVSAGVPAKVLKYRN